MKFITAGESHGPSLTAIVSGVPAGLRINEEQINADLARRQPKFLASEGQETERDHVIISSGVRFGKTLGSPITLTVANNDAKQWSDRMANFGTPPKNLAREVVPRPGHADLVGVLKNATNDCRNVFERASARETVVRVVAGGVAREFLAELGVDVFSFVTRIGTAEFVEDNPIEAAPEYKPLDIEMSEVRCPNAEATEHMLKMIKVARTKGESLGGTFRVVATGLVPGLGGFESGPERLNSQLAAALFSIPAIKGVEFGLGFASAALNGSDVHDAITHTKKHGFSRASNHAGGLEGGMTTGLPLIMTAAMKPLPSMTSALPSINLDTLESEEARSDRSDVCAVPSAAVVAEAEVAFVLANAYLRKFGSDNMEDIYTALAAYKKRLAAQAR